MCLMCEFYYDLCDEPGCVERATGDERFTSRGGKGCFLWKGYSEPCEHIKAKHGPHCAVVEKQYDDFWGEYLYDECNCEEVDEDMTGKKYWTYY